MDVPAPAAGTVVAVKVKVGDTVSAGHPILELRTSWPPPAGEPAAAPTPSPAARPPMTERGDVHAEVLVLGAGPGGTPPHSAPPTSARGRAGRPRGGLAACVSTSAAFRPRRCCTPRR